MKSSRKIPFAIASLVLVTLLLLFAIEALNGGMLSGGVHGSGWMEDRGWIWNFALITLSLGIVTGWVMFRRKY